MDCETSITKINKAKYQKGKVYCIRNKINNDVYIGSTCQSLSQRMSEHRQALKKDKYNNMKIYQLIKKIGLEHFYIELIEDYPCENVYQLHRREGELIREYKASLNQVIAGRTSEEYIIDNHDRIKQTKTISDKKYAEKNKERIQEYQKNYYHKNRQRILENVQNYSEEQKEEKRRRDRERYHRKKAEKQSSIDDMD